MLMAAWSICHHFYGLSCQHCVLVPKTYLVLNAMLILLSKYLRLIEFSGFIHLFSFLIHLVKPTLKQLSILTLQFGVPFLCCLNLELKGLQFIVDDLISVSIGFIVSMKKDVPGLSHPFHAIVQSEAHIWHWVALQSMSIVWSYKIQYQLWSKVPNVSYTLLGSILLLFLFSDT